MPQSNSNRKKKNILNGRPKGMFKNVNPKDPPTRNTKLFMTHTFRYQCVSANIANISAADLFGMLSVVVVPSSAGISLMSAIRLRKISIWQTGVLTTPGVAVIDLEPTVVAGAYGTKPVILSDSSFSANQYARIVFVPSAKTQIAAWVNTYSGSDTTGDYQFNINANVGDTMDIKIDFCLNVNDPTITSVSSTTAVGRIYGTPLPQTTAIWTPVSFQK